ncbi:MAG: multicopper oxidase domain-containing protein [Pseudomonadota bacterium]|nr:multicopper oxidase domain-containing protein [Pseudomonadota bacterium]
MIWTRRDVLKSFVASAGQLALGAPLHGAGAGLEPDLILRLTAAPGTAWIRGGDETRVLRYSGEVLRGRKDALKPATGFLGPTIELWRGERVRIVFRNRLEQSSIIHWHGMIVPDVADGHPRFAISPGGEYRYDFTVVNPAGTYLYHPHPHGRTGEQVYFGLAGLLIVRDRDEARFGLPSTENELALVIQDRRFGADNKLVFKRMMMDEMNGVLGDTVLVNGGADAAFAVKPQAYRLHLANVSNARVYKLAWSDGRPLRVIAADNGLFSSAEGPKEVPFAMLAPFQRIELIEDFGARRSGQEFGLISESYASLGMAAMMRDMMGGTAKRRGRARRGREHDGRRDDGWHDAHDGSGSGRPATCRPLHRCAGRTRPGGRDQASSRGRGGRQARAGTQFPTGVCSYAGAPE